jgi:Asp-tRNA(Asn)/Glu-tRNA(Gln) amidotransferase A subunit family amidase
MTALTDLTIAGALDGLAKKQFSSRELTEAHVRAVEAARDLNAFITETPDRALEMAKASDARRAKGDGTLLEGIPLAIKDLFCTDGVLTTSGSHILDGFKPTYESTVTANLWRAGAVMLGKTNMDEFAMGSSNMTSYYGHVANPWRRRGDNRPLVPGGSSGGSAAAVAARIALGATGTDTGGSIRQPAAFSGIVGIKPTYGRCSRWGIVAFASSLDQAGPMTRTVEDAAIMLRAMAGYDPKDSTSVNAPVPDYRKALTGDVRGLKVGIPKEYRIDGMAPEIDKLWADGIAWLKAAGAEPVDISLPHTKYALPTYYIIAPGRGLLEPRALRRRALRPARARREPRRHVREHARRRLRQGSAPPRPHRHLCALRRLLRRLLPESAEGPRPHRQRLHRSLQDGRRGADALDAERRLRRRRKDGRPHRHVPERRVHGDGESCRPPGHQRPRRPLRRRSPPGSPAHRQGLRRGNGAARGAGVGESRRLQGASRRCKVNHKATKHTKMIARHEQLHLHVNFVFFVPLWCVFWKRRDG